MEIIQAYLDPGSLSIMWQALVAALVAGLAGIAFGWRKIKYFFSKLFGKNKKKFEIKSQ